ncbi:MAG: hypothetical protein ACLPKE_02865 [Streptosporangiaceae bacterium]
MTFRRGFVVTDKTFFFPDITDATGEPTPLDGVESPMFIDKGTLVEVDDAYQGGGHGQHSLVRTAVSGHEGHYFVAKLFTTDLKDVRAEHAAARIAEIEREENLAVLTKAAEGWVERGVVLWWIENPPDGLEVDTEAKVVTVGKDSITFRRSSGGDVVVPITEFQLDDIQFKRTSEEVAEREQKLEKNKDLTVLTYQQAIGFLAEVQLLTAWTSKAGAAVPITVAETSEVFEKGCVAHLMANQTFQGGEVYAQHEAKLVNGYTDRVSGSPAIFLRPGTQGTGIEVHEAVHTLCNAKFEAETSFFLSEGITEYFTRMATAETFDRSDLYDTEHYFVDQLVKQNASTPQILAKLYFGGDWTSFYQGLYDYAELVSIQVLLDRAAGSLSFAAVGYLKELKDDPEAPLRQYQ